MAGIGAQVAIINDDEHILLILREDFEVWALPGGEVDAGESLAQAAIREAKEETGLDVRLTRLVGLYSLPRWQGGNNHIALFAAIPVGGEITPQPGEALNARFFSPDELPDNLLWWHYRRIYDALEGVGGSVAVLQDVPWPANSAADRAALYAARDQSGVSRQDFALRQFGRSGYEAVEVGIDFFDDDVYDD